MEEEMYFCLFSAFLLSEFFNQCIEFYLAWLSLSEQPSGAAELYFHLPASYGDRGMVWKEKAEQQERPGTVFSLMRRFCPSMPEADYK